MPPPDTTGGVETAGLLAHGREAYATRAWRAAYTALSAADRVAPLAAGDLELLATSASMVGLDDDWLSALERAHHAHLDAGDTARATHCAVWLGLYLGLRGQFAQASGWFGRAKRLVDRIDGECVEQGYLLVPVMMQHEAAGEYDEAYRHAVDAATIGERFGDADLLAISLHEQGRMLAKQGRTEPGLQLLDEVMVAVTGGELSPIVTGLIYCSVIEGCQEVYELRRAHDWTAALSRWCDAQPEMVSFTGRCLVHRAEIMQLHGAWHDALEEARRAAERFRGVKSEMAVGEAFYRQGEIHRLHGDFASAEEAFREASRCGWEPQPGLALLRIANGDNDAAGAAIRRLERETTDPLKRAGLLAAYVEIMLKVGDAGEARDASAEFDEIAQRYRSGMLEAMAAHARGAVKLADGDAWAALVALRHACRVWQELGVPYEAARARVLVGLACREIGDADTAEMELDAAGETFRALGAEADLGRVETLSESVARAPGGLTDRELQVLGLVATGKTNRAIAEALVISEKTVARHVSNIFGKLGVSSRAAATAYAYEHDLV
ncbi:MAG: hypothetical protein QOJ13_1890 [Gaiellales bacterium]|jgi:ATP/maltotriose-dependent transcriptional regulator MalT|nr:hypothetical protein [Gaiellales bacterium]